MASSGNQVSFTVASEAVRMKSCPENSNAVWHRDWAIQRHLSFFLETRHSQIHLWWPKFFFGQNSQFWSFFFGDQITNPLHIRVKILTQCDTEIERSRDIWGFSWKLGTLRYICDDQNFSLVKILNFGLFLKGCFLKISWTITFETMLWQPSLIADTSFLATHTPRNQTNKCIGNTHSR